MVTEEQIDKIVKELERLIEEEDPEVVEKLKDPEYSKEILTGIFGKQKAVVELTAILTIAQLILTIAQIINTGIDIKKEKMKEVKKIEVILKDAGIKEEKAEEIVLEVIESASI
jgi:dipeptidase